MLRKMKFDKLLNPFLSAFEKTRGQLDKIFTDFVNEDPTEEFDPVPSEMINKAKKLYSKNLNRMRKAKNVCRFDNNNKGGS